MTAKMRRWAAAALGAALLTGGLGACGDDDDEDTPGATNTTVAAGGEATALRIVANEYSFQAPATVAGGVVDIEFKNEGKLVHEAFLLDVGDTPQAEVLAEFKKIVTSEEGVPIPDFINAAGGAVETEPGETTETSVTLSAGNYLVVCTLTDADSEDDEEGEGDEAEGEEGGGAAEAEEPVLPVHFEIGMVVPLTVTGGAAAATLPEADAQVTARDYAFDVQGLEAGDETVNFTNAGPGQIHHAVVFEFEEGIDAAAAEAAFKAFGQAEATGTPPPEGTPEPEDAGGSSVFNPGRSGTFTGEFKSGRTYLFACFINDRAGGPPHAFAHDMIKAVAVA